MPRKSGRENWVQAAITGALEVYCSSGGRPQFRQFPPFANQQGERMRQYCGDLIGMLDNARTVLLEIKERDYRCNMLNEFKQEQHDYNLRFEELGVPIAYAYNETAESDLEYNKFPRNVDWPAATLSQIKRAAPSDLPGICPNVLEHNSLLDWLQEGSGADITELIGRMQGTINCPGDLRNGVLVLLYGVSENVLTTLSTFQLLEVVSYINNNSTLKKQYMLKLQRILGAESAVFNGFRATSAAPAPSTPDQDDYDRFSP